MAQQLPIFKPETPPDLDLNYYDKIIIFHSEGKDSIATFLHVLSKLGPAETSRKVELWHHLIDGKTSQLMDWPCTEAYCKALAAAFNVPLYFSWKTGGFEKEMLRENAKTSSTKFEDQDHGIVECGGIGGKFSTRRMFPQKAASLSVRWCSAYLKIDVAAKAITNQIRFCNSKTLCISGERAEESAARAKYKTFEPHRTDRRHSNKLRREVDHWRPVHDWDEKRVWDIMEHYKVQAHPAYHLGWGRLSCCACIFGSLAQWASVRYVAPQMFNNISCLEKDFGKTIDRKLTVDEMADKGEIFKGCFDKELIKIAMSPACNEPIIVNNWKLPSGAFGDSAGPT